MKNSEINNIIEIESSSCKSTPIKINPANNIILLESALKDHFKKKSKKIAYELYKAFEENTPYNNFDKISQNIYTMRFNKILDGLKNMKKNSKNKKNLLILLKNKKFKDFCKQFTNLPDEDEILSKKIKRFPPRMRQIRKLGTIWRIKKENNEQSGCFDTNTGYGLNSAKEKQFLKKEPIELLFKDVENVEKDEEFEKNEKIKLFPNSLYTEENLNKLRIFYKHLAKAKDHIEFPKTSPVNEIINNKITNNEINEMINNEINEINNKEINEINNKEINEIINSEIINNEIINIEINNNEINNNEISNNEITNNEINEINNNEINEIINNEINEINNNEINNNELNNIEINNNEINNNEINNNEINEIINNEINNNEIINKEIINNEIINNEIVNNEITINEITNNEITNNEITNHEITNNEITNNEIPKKGYFSNEMDIYSEEIKLQGQFGVIYQNLGQISKVEECYKKAMKMWEDFENYRIKEKIDFTNPQILSWLNQKGEIYSQLGTIYSSIRNFKKAEECYLQELKIIQSLFGENHKNTAVRYNNLGVFYSESGNPQQSEEYYHKALKIKIASYGEDHFETSITLNNLGMYYQRIKNLTKAEEYYQKSLKIKLAYCGENHVDTALAYFNLSILYKEMQKIEMAKAFGIRACNIMSSLYGVNNSMTRRMMENLNRIVKI